MLSLQVREDELPELEQHLTDSCVTDVKGGTENEYGKVNILLQTYISNCLLYTSPSPRDS